MTEGTSANWRKATDSYSSGGCVEVADWRKSRRSVHNGACLEVAAHSRDLGAGVLVRDTKQDGQPGRTVLAYPREAWDVFVRGVKSGGFR